MREYSTPPSTYPPTSGNLTDDVVRNAAEAPDLARRLAKGGRDYVLEHYTWEQMLDGVE